MSSSLLDVVTERGSMDPRWNNSHGTARSGAPTEKRANFAQNGKSTTILGMTEINQAKGFHRIAASV